MCVHIQNFSLLFNFMSNLEFSLKILSPLIRSLEYAASQNML